MDEKILTADSDAGEFVDKSRIILVPRSLLETLYLRLPKIFCGRRMKKFPRPKEQFTWTKKF